MLAISKYMLVLGRVVLLLFILGNSGFSAVISYCTMHPDQSTGCCEVGRVENPRSCCEVSRPAAQSRQSLTYQCHVSTLAGGLSGIQAVVEKFFASSNETHGLFQPVPVWAEPTLLLQFASQAFSTVAPSPPHVEKYLLDAAFLI